MIDDTPPRVRVDPDLLDDDGLVYIVETPIDSYSHDKFLYVDLDKLSDEMLASVLIEAGLRFVSAIKTAEFDEDFRFMSADEVIELYKKDKK